MQRYVMTLARWLASKAIRAQWKASGRKPEAREIAKTTNVYFMEHRKELIEEAWEHPVAKEYRHQEGMRLARKAVIAEIRDKGRKVNSIEPSELKKLVEAYLNEHPGENVIKTFICY
jgi:hypothetical protein